MMVRVVIFSAVSSIVLRLPHVIFPTQELQGGGLYNKVSANFSKFLHRFTTVPNTDAVNRGLRSCCHKLLGDGS